MPKPTWNGKGTMVESVGRRWTAPRYTPPVGRFVILVVDGCGCGEAPDAATFGDQGSDTLGNTARIVGGLHLPNLAALGLGRIGRIQGVPAVDSPSGGYGRMLGASDGKDTTTGHWEMMGIVLGKGFTTYPGGFPSELVERWKKDAGIGGVLANRAASGTQILEELGEEHVRTGWPILYTSADSVFQVAAHESVVPLARLYEWCEIARRLCKEYGVARVIARPFIGDSKATFKRTYNRKDFVQRPPETTILERVHQGGVPTIGVGKIHNIFDGGGVGMDVHTEGNTDGLQKTLRLIDENPRGLVFVNLVDTDMLYGHRNDPVGFARAMEELDRAVPEILARLGPGDVLALTADHGCDPTTPSTDHSREYVPLLVAAKGVERGVDLGTRGTLADLGATVHEYFGLGDAGRGKSFLGSVK